MIKTILPLLVLSFILPLVAPAQQVDPLTGRLQMSIPIGALQANDISIPISIYNKGTSIEVAEGENDCGLGWGLSAGGAVTRVVRGLPDEINTAAKKGWLYNSNANAVAVQNFNPTADDDLSICTDEVTDWNTLEAIHANYVNDTEPDLFYINAPGLSAQFVFGPDGTPRLLTHADIIISFQSSSSPLEVIIVKTNTGLTYTFGANDFVARSSRFPSTTTTDRNTDCRYFITSPVGLSLGETYFNTKWKIVSIASNTTGTLATFKYRIPDPNLALRPDGAGRHYLNIDSTNYLYDIYYRYELESISLKSFTATFNWSNKLLQSVTITEGNTQDKSITQFEYGGFPSKQYIQTNRVNKSCLKAIKQNGSKCLSAQVHEFEYVDETQSGTYLDWIKNWGQDYFGYPNADAANKNKPTLYFATGEQDGRRLRTTSVAGAGYLATTGQNRNPSITTGLFGALKKITLPSGGFVEVQYEANRYTDNSVSPSQQLIGGGARVKKIISQGGEAAFGKLDATSDYRTTVKDYEYLEAGSANSSGRLLSPIKLGYLTHLGTDVDSKIKRVVDNIGEEPAVLYSYVKEKITGKGYTVYEFNIPGVFPETAVGEWKATKSRIARKPGGTCISAGDVKNGYYLFPYAPSTNYDFKRGRISKVTTYSETGQLIQQKNTSYTTLTKNPTTIKGLRFEKISDVYYYGLYEILTGRIDAVSQETVTEASHEDPTKLLTTTTAYAYNANLFLESVTTTLPNSTTTVKALKYASDFPFTSPLATDTAAVALKALNTTSRGSALVEERTLVTIPGSAQVTTNAQLIIYRDFGNNLILPYYMKTLLPGATLAPATMSGQSFVHDNANYRLVRTIKEYDSEGRILTEFDDKKNTMSTHYVKDPSYSVATFYNARAQQSVYEGFEGISSYGLTQSGTGFQNSAGWTGEKAVTFMDNTSALVSSATNLIQKNGNKYRVSCWVYSPANKVITFNAKSSSTVVSTLSLTNTLNNKWNYLEGEMNTASVTGGFTLEVKTDATLLATVTVDDIVFMPTLARVSLQTMLPFKGITSATDDRGNSVKTTYDHLSRPVNTLDRFRNLVQRNEYAERKSTNREPKVGFHSSVDQYLINTPITFTPDDWGGCDPSLTYAWQVDGIGQASGPGNVLNYSFTNLGSHTVNLTATNSFGIKTVSQTFCVGYKPDGIFSVVITDQNGNPISTYDCFTNPIPVINYSLNYTGSTLPSGCQVKTNWTSSVVTANGVTTTTYIANYYIDCSAYKDCAVYSQVFTMGQAIGEVGYILRLNCP
jgi:hypothetical protein